MTKIMSCFISWMIAVKLHIRLKQTWSPAMLSVNRVSSFAVSHLVIVTVETECASTSSAASSYAFLSSWFSAVLLACGIPKEVAERTVRFSFGRETTKDDVSLGSPQPESCSWIWKLQVDRVVKELKAILFLAKHGSSLMNVINKGPVPGFWLLRGRH